MHDYATHPQVGDGAFEEGGTGDARLVGALSVTADERKLSLAAVEGSTENKTLAARLVADRRDRGLDVSRGVLFVVDGSRHT